MGEAGIVVNVWQGQGKSDPGTVSNTDCCRQGIRDLNVYSSSKSVETALGWTEICQGPNKDREGRVGNEGVAWCAVREMKPMGMLYWSQGLLLSQ